MPRFVVVLVAVAIIVVASLGAIHPAGEPAPPPGDPAAVGLAPDELDGAPIGAVTTAADVVVLAAPSPDAEAVAQLPPGILLPVTEVREGFAHVLTPCEDPGWVELTGLRAHTVAGERPGAVGDATIVLDPGHGGQHPGAVGAGGLTEEVINLDIAGRVADKLGDARVFLTRNADYTTGLAFRTEVANRLGAHAFVSIHHNAAPDGASEGPGSETYYQQRSPESQRLGGLLYEEVVAVLSVHDIDWVADTDAGAKTRPRPDGEDLYGVLRMSQRPAVLLENLFISNPAEEQLLRREDVREALADAIVRGITRFVETEDPGSGFVEGKPIRGASSGRLPTECLDPS